MIRVFRRIEHAKRMKEMPEWFKDALATTKNDDFKQKLADYVEKSEEVLKAKKFIKKQ